MKSERRHELQTNALAKTLHRTPELLEQYGGKIAFAVIALAVLGGLLYFRASTLRASEQFAAENLQNARSLIEDLRRQPETARDPQTRSELPIQAERALEAAVSSDESRLIAEALLVKGDLHWLLATLPQPAPATQPATLPALSAAASPEESLQIAEQAYQRVLKEHPEQTVAGVTARFGLAAIAETRGQWDVARQQYESVKTMEGASDVFRDYADQRLAQLAELQKPVYFASASPTASPTETPVQVIKVTPGEGAVQLDPSSEEFRAAAAGAAQAENTPAPTTAPAQP